MKAKYNDTFTCPLCGQTDEIQYDGHDIDGAHAFYHASCPKCGAYWDEVFEMNFIGCENIGKSK